MSWMSADTKPITTFGKSSKTTTTSSSLVSSSSSLGLGFGKDRAVFGIAGSSSSSSTTGRGVAGNTTIIFKDNFLDGFVGGGSGNSGNGFTSSNSSNQNSHSSSNGAFSKGIGMNQSQPLQTRDPNVVFGGFHGIASGGSGLGKADKIDSAPPPPPLPLRATSSKRPNDNFEQDKRSKQLPPRSKKKPMDMKEIISMRDEDDLLLLHKKLSAISSVGTTFAFISIRYEEIPRGDREGFLNWLELLGFERSDSDMVPSTAVLKISTLGVDTLISATDFRLQSSMVRGVAGKSFPGNFMQVKEKLSIAIPSVPASLPFQSISQFRDTQSCSPSETPSPRYNDSASPQSARSGPFGASLPARSRSFKEVEDNGGRPAESPSTIGLMNLLESGMSFNDRQSPRFGGGANNVVVNTSYISTTIASVISSAPTGGGSNDVQQTAQSMPMSVPLATPSIPSHSNATRSTNMGAPLSLPVSSQQATAAAQVRGSRSGSMDLFDAASFHLIDKSMNRDNLNSRGGVSKSSSQNNKNGGNLHGVLGRSSNIPSSISQSRGGRIGGSSIVNNDSDDDSITKELLDSPENGDQTHDDFQFAQTDDSVSQAVASASSRVQNPVNESSFDLDNLHLPATISCRNLNHHQSNDVDISRWSIGSNVSNNGRFSGMFVGIADLSPFGTGGNNRRDSNGSEVFTLGAAGMYDHSNGNYQSSSNSHSNGGMYGDSNYIGGYNSSNNNIGSGSNNHTEQDDHNIFGKWSTGKSNVSLPGKKKHLEGSRGSINPLVHHNSNNSYSSNSSVTNNHSRTLRRSNTDPIRSVELTPGASHGLGAGHSSRTDSLSQNDVIGCDREFTTPNGKLTFSPTGYDLSETTSYEEIVRFREIFEENKKLKSHFHTLYGSAGNRALRRVKSMVEQSSLRYSGGGSSLFADHASGLGLPPRVETSQIVNACLSPFHNRASFNSHSFAGGNNNSEATPNPNMDSLVSMTTSSEKPFMNMHPTFSSSFNMLNHQGGIGNNNSNNNGNNTGNSAFNGRLSNGSVGNGGAIFSGLSFLGGSSASAHSTPIYSSIQADDQHRRVMPQHANVGSIFHADPPRSIRSHSAAAVATLEANGLPYSLDNGVGGLEVRGGGGFVGGGYRQHDDGHERIVNSNGNEIMSSASSVGSNTAADKVDLDIDTDVDSDSDRNRVGSHRESARFMKSKQKYKRMSMGMALVKQTRQSSVYGGSAMGDGGGGDMMAAAMQGGGAFSSLTSTSSVSSGFMLKPLNRRGSMSAAAQSDRAMFSPGAKGKAKRGSMRNFVSFISDDHADDSENLDNSFDAANATELEMEVNSHYQRLSYHFSGGNFRAVVVGATYQQCFDGNHPVIAPPMTSDCRVTSVEIEHMSSTTTLEGSLRLVLTWGRDTKEVILSPDWHFCRASPSGYLIYDNQLELDVGMECFYISKHPKYWLNGDSASYTSAGVFSSRPFFSSGPFGQTVPSSSGGPVDSGNMDQSSSDVTESDDMSDSQWNNTAIAANILQFLLPSDAASSVSSSMAVTRGTRGVRNRGGMRAGSGLSEFAAYASVSKAWALGAAQLISESKSQWSNVPFAGAQEWSSFMTKYNWGKFLSRGACKDVYCVYNSAQKRMDVVSVMDIEDLVSRQMDVAITQELQISLVCSSLNKLNICPNLVEVFTIFQSEFGPASKLWRHKSMLSDAEASRLRVINPRTNDVSRGQFQFIRQEFCHGGDLEEHVRSVRTLSPDTIRSFLLQIAFSVYCCRDQLSLRHYDIKLLNFFVARGGSVRNVNPAASKINLNIGFGESIYRIPMQSGDLALVKLADFGTSAIGLAGLGDCIGVQQFTTLENTPPEFLLQGSVARQSFAADTFCIGLSFLHLLTGYEPYEVLLDSIKCPEYLIKKLWNIWYTGDPNSPFHVIKEVIDSLEVDPAIPEHPGTILCHTLYRYMVLFYPSMDSQLRQTSEEGLMSKSPVWKLLKETLIPAPQSGPGGARAAAKASEKKRCLDTFKRDVDQWSIRYGAHAVMVSLRSNIAHLSSTAVASSGGGIGGGSCAMELLERMIHFDPSMRCTMFEVMQNPIFHCLRTPSIGHEHEAVFGDVCGSSNNNSNNSSGNSGEDANYLHYYKPLGTLNMI